MVNGNNIIQMEKIKEIGSFKDGKKTGLFKWFYSNGMAEKSGFFNLDIPTGEWKSYHPNKNLKKSVHITRVK